MADRDYDNDDDEALPPAISVSKFDDSVENHIRAINTLSKISGESECDFEQNEIQRLSSSITFLREWKHFCYQPRDIRFACQNENFQSSNVTGGINLPQFSAAAVPKKDRSDGNEFSPKLSKDSVMYVGGLVWALDWCPRVHHRPDSDANLEFIAVAAHPPESSYHKIGAPLTGRGVVQIWCLLNAGVKDQDVISWVKDKPRKYCRSNEAKELKETQPKRPRGRPRKNPINVDVDNLKGNGQHPQALAVQFPGESTKLLDEDGISQDSLKQVAVGDTQKSVKSSKPPRPRGRPKKLPIKGLDNLDGSNSHAQSIDKCPDASSRMNEIFLRTPEIFSKVTFTCQDDPAGNSAEQQQNSEGTSAKGKTDEHKGTPEKKRRKDSADDFDGSNHDLQPLAVVFPEDTSYSLAMHASSFETPEIIAEVDNSRRHDCLSVGASPKEQQTHRGSGEKNLKSSEPKKLQSRKKSTEVSVDNSKFCNQHMPALPVPLTENSSKMLPEDEIRSKTHEQVSKKDTSRKRQGYEKRDSEKSVATASKSILTKCQAGINNQINGNDLPVSAQNSGTSLLNFETSSNYGQNPARSSKRKANSVSSETDPDSCSIPEDVALPRLVLCLAHNGKVAWDVKWRPLDSANPKYRMGYLAVLLGNGALEVWEVPLPRATNAIFSSCQKEGTDPRFVKLDPVFRCSILKCGDRQSIPLTVEWSTSSPHDLILAGCHDGVVALWKFSAGGPSKDSRPLLCFSADTVPIRALAWAPAASDPESANIVVTAGHKGVKFWDIRDPFRPLWDVNPVPRIIYSLDWLPDPRCIVLSFDDGEIRILSLVKAACDVPVTGTPFVGTQQQGLSSYYCSSSSIWNVQVSRLTGMVAYCCADGTVLQFQLTTKAVERDPRRNREPHYLCGSLIEEGSILTVLSPYPGIPFPMKKSSNEWGDTPRSRRGFLAVSNQEKRAKVQMTKCQTPEEQPLALCYGNDPVNDDSVSEGTLVALNSKQTFKTKRSSKNKQKTGQALTCVNETPESYKSEEENVKENMDEEQEVFPPKIVAMHRVRWNMNKGSERWLCYGGAAGILRCQEVNLS